MKKIVIIAYATEAESDLSAMLELRRSLYTLPESELAKFEAFDVVDSVSDFEMSDPYGKISI